jgi:hypothetical protein
MTMTQRQHSGFARFENIRAREEFAQAILQPDARLGECAYMSSSQPTIVFERLSTEQQQQILHGLQGHGQWFEDVQFEPTR